MQKGAWKANGPCLWYSAESGGRNRTMSEYSIAFTMVQGCFHLLLLCLAICMPYSARAYSLHLLDTTVSGQGSSTMQCQVYDPNDGQTRSTSVVNFFPISFLQSANGIAAAAGGSQLTVAAYDPGDLQWHTASVGTFFNVSFMQAADGIAAAAGGSQLTVAAYDPGDRQWHTASVGTFYDVSFMQAADGIAAAAGSYRLTVAAYDPCDRLWHQETHSFGSVITSLSISNGVVSCVAGGALYTYFVARTPQAYIAADLVSGNAPLYVQFSDNSFGGSAYWWNFGVSGGSSQRSPSHTFTDYGIYNVTFQVTGPGGSHSTNIQIKTDIAAPNGTLLINGGEDIVNSTSVVLTVSATDNSGAVVTMRFSNDDTSWSDWETFTTNTSWSLAAGDGLKTVFVQFKDGANNISVSFTDTITLDMSAPEMDVQGNSTTIANGDSAPSAADHTDYGSALVAGGPVMRTYTITNSGNAALILTGTPMLVVDGAQSAEFTVTSQPTTPVAVGGAETFQVVFAPTGIGLRHATLSIENNDGDENPYHFSIQGTGVAASLEIEPPHVNVANDASNCLTIGVIANVAWTANSNVSWIAVIAGNSGDGDGAVTFSVATNGGASARTGGVIVAGGGVARTCTVVQAGASAQRIIGLTGNLAYGNVMTGQTLTATMTITNAGNSPLTVTGISYPSGFSGAWSGSIVAGEAANVAVMFSPVAVMIYGGTVTVICDATEGTGSISVSGTGRAGQPEAQNDESFGVISNQFGFNIGWADGQTIVVEGCTNLTQTNWSTVVTNTLTNGTFYFRDPEWTNFFGRFYRIRSVP